MRTIALTIALVSSPGLIGCDQDQAAHAEASAVQARQASTSQAPTTQPATIPATPLRPAGSQDSGPLREAAFLDYVAPLPAAWTAYPPENQMRAANWVVPAASGGSQAHVVVFKGIGGGTHANIERWMGQVMGPDGGPAQPAISKIDAGELDITFVELAGGYRGMGAPDFAPDHMFLGALWDGASGPVQVRLVGRTATVEAARADFMRFLEGLRIAGAAPEGEFPEDWYYIDRATGSRYANTKLLEGHPAPKLELASWIGDPVTLEQLEGKIVVVDFWATWCGPCMKSLPHNVELAEKYRERGVAFLGVHDSKRGSERMPSVVESMKLNYPTAVDVESKSEKAWNVKFWPTYIVIDHEGVVRAAGLSPSKIGDVIEALLRARDGG